MSRGECPDPAAGKIYRYIGHVSQTSQYMLYTQSTQVHIRAVSLQSPLEYGTFNWRYLMLPHNVRCYAQRGIYAIARRPSIHPSVTHRYSIETAKHIVKLFTIGQPHHSIFPMPCTVRYNTPLMGASNAGNMKNRDFRPISRVISEMIQESYRT